MKKPQAGATDPGKLRDTCFFVDISALMELSWTGIAQVTANLAREIYRRFPTRSYFFVRDQVVDPYFMLAAIETAPGAYLDVLLQNGFGELGRLKDFVWRDKRSVGLFPNIKTLHRVFDVELVVLHDLSAMLMPELHEGWAADLHTRAMARDTATSDLVCCVSEATRQDALAYLPFDGRKAFVSHLGVHEPVAETVAADAATAKPPYVLVLGTVEPRKNLRLVAEFFSSRTDLLRDLPVVFAGRRGWGQQFNQIFGKLLEDPALRDRIVFTGYVDEADKWALIRGAKFAIFPSLFEGFGLPVVECMAAGCPVIAGRTSSLVEFGLPDEMYFDPFSLVDFARAFRHINTMAEPARLALGEKLERQARQFTWTAFSDRIVEAIAARC
jgi:glycosyltransferase involved in cell wall biosynthesis